MNTRVAWGIMFLIGMLLLVFGMWLVWYPLAPITAGICLIVVACLGASTEKGGA